MMLWPIVAVIAGGALIVGLASLPGRREPSTHRRAKPRLAQPRRRRREPPPWPRHRRHRDPYAPLHHDPHQDRGVRPPPPSA